MTVIFPGGEFLEFIYNRNKNNSLAGNIPVIKKVPLRFFLLSGGPFAQICAFVFARVHDAGSPGVG